MVTLASIISRFESYGLVRSSQSERLSSKFLYFQPTEWFLIGTSHYQNKVLPFCTIHSPEDVFTKVLTIAAAHVMRQGIQVYPYLNDWLIWGLSLLQFRFYIQITLWTSLPLWTSESEVHTNSKTKHRINRGSVKYQVASTEVLLIDIQHLQPQPMTQVRTSLMLLWYMTCTHILPHARLCLCWNQCICPIGTAWSSQFPSPGRPVLIKLVAATGISMQENSIL